MSHDEGSLTLAVVILSHNRRDVIERHLRYAADALTAGDCSEVVVVDNGSNDGSQEMIRAILSDCPHVMARLCVENTGVAAGRNAGFASITSEVVLSLDDDAFLPAPLWSQALAWFASNPNLGVLAPRVVHAENGSEQGYKGENGSEIANFHGAGHFVRRSAFEAVGGYDEYCRFGGEELDLSMRLKSQGFSVVFTDELVVKHLSLVRMGPLRVDRLSSWARSYAYVYAKNLSPLRGALLSGRRLVSCLSSYVESDFIAVWASVAKSVVRGFVDGFKVRQPLSLSARRFYSDPGLEPEFGNAPIGRRTIRWIIRRVRA